MMQQTIKVDVLGARRVNVDGNTYSKLFLAQREDENKDVYGVIPMTLTCESEVIDQLKAHELPKLLEVRVLLRLAGGGKTGMHALGIETAANNTHRPATSGQAPAQPAKA